MSMEDDLAQVCDGQRFEHYWFTLSTDRATVRVDQAGDFDASGTDEDIAALVSLVSPARGYVRAEIIYALLDPEIVRLELTGGGVPAVLEFSGHASNAHRIAHLCEYFASSGEHLRQGASHYRRRA